MKILPEWRVWSSCCQRDWLKMEITGAVQRELARARHY
jgi:hypothetical protein